MKYLLDTNIISELRKRGRAHPNVARWAERTPVEDIGTSVIVLAEIRRGIELKRRRDPAQADLLLSGSQDHYLKVWDVLQGKQSCEYWARAPVQSVAVDPTAQRAAVADATGQVHVLELVAR